MPLTECFWTFLVTALVALAYKILRWTYKSKCSEVNFLGCVIKRDIEAEIEIISDISSSESSSSFNLSVESVV